MQAGNKPDPRHDMMPDQLSLLFPPNLIFAFLPVFQASFLLYTSPYTYAFSSCCPSRPFHFPGKKNEPR